MNRYAIYLAASGQIVRIVRCPASQAAVQIGDGEALLPCAEEVTDATHRVEGGVIVPLVGE